MNNCSTTSLTSLDAAREEITASSAAGAPFLLAFGSTLLAAGLLGLVLPSGVAAIVLLFQGNVALPLAFWLERRMATRRMSPDNPLKPLSIQLAMTQVVALPAVILAFAFAHWTVPAAFAAIGGGHFLPYAWLQRTRVYLVLGVAVSLGAAAITLVLREQAFTPALLYMTACYWVAAAILLRSRMVRAAATAA